MIKGAELFTGVGKTAETREAIILREDISEKKNTRSSRLAILLLENFIEDATKPKREDWNRIDKNRR